ncbi:hypothetical protein RJT34_18642 [Clitoria ternatea]|uniref:Uncharacterized protein n=1 Tax=Clitoria ternatea TaxID=43366 RepID=A0AAN9PE73_CLITE
MGKTHNNRKWEAKAKHRGKRCPILKSESNGSHCISFFLYSIPIFHLYLVSLSFASPPSLCAFSLALCLPSPLGISLPKIIEDGRR